jgi:hypothetical protein
MQDKINAALSGLKDFQLSTVDYVFKQLYGEGRDKMLIADEVGLGKTIVAQGLIAKAVERHLKSKQERPFNVVYVCSNLAIARQNLRKLNFTKDEKAVIYRSEDDRITSLAYIGELVQANTPLSIRAFTPATSFDSKTHAGRRDERVLLYRILAQYADLEPFKNSLKWILKGTGRILADNWEASISEAEYADANSDYRYVRAFRPEVKAKLRELLEEEVEYNRLPNTFYQLNTAGGTQYAKLKSWTLLRKLVELNFRRNSPASTMYFARELVSYLRLKLSQACIGFLNADMFILDEFQRYKELIDDESEDVSEATELVRAIFSRK